MTTPNDDRLLGSLIEAVKNLSEDIRSLRGDLLRSEEKSDASRAAVHRRLDEQALQVAKIETTVAVQGAIDAQLRDEIAALQKTVQKNHEEVTPSLADWRRIKTIGLGISGLIAFTGISIGVFASWASETAVAAIRHWLKIP